MMFAQELGERDAIPPGLTRRVMINFRERLQQCIDNDDRHLSDIVFKNTLKQYIILCSNQK